MKVTASWLAEQFPAYDPSYWESSLRPGTHDNAVLGLGQWLGALALRRAIGDALGIDGQLDCLPSEVLDADDLVAAVAGLNVKYSARCAELLRLRSADPAPPAPPEAERGGPITTPAKRSQPH